MIETTDQLARRLERYRSAVGRPSGAPSSAARLSTTGGVTLAERLAEAVGGEVRTSSAGSVVRCDSPPRPLVVDRRRLAALPGQPPADAPLVCLDTETTGLATAAGTVAFLVGLGWWEGDAFVQTQLYVPDHADEPAMLAALRELIPSDAWLVTYNGRGFDWPLLVARYRLHGSAAPVHAGHLDLLPIVRRLFRHRMEDARLRSAEAHLLGVRRHGDVDGWEIPGRYLGFLRGDPAEPLADVGRHNDQDVRSLARLLAYLERSFGDRDVLATCHPGDLAGLARAFARQGQLAQALDCLDLAMDAPIPPAVGRAAEPAWWSPAARPDFGAIPRHREPVARPDRGDPWTSERIAIERARLQKRSGDRRAALRSWASLATTSGRTGILAAIELAKLREHQFRDLTGAMHAVSAGLAQAERRRRIGRPEPALERDLRRRGDRLSRRLTRVAGRGPRPTGPAQPGSSPSRA